MIRLAMQTERSSLNHINLIRVQHLSSSSDIFPKVGFCWALAAKFKKGEKIVNDCVDFVP
jgi:hypothetical protein